MFQVYTGKCASGWKGAVHVAVELCIYSSYSNAILFWEYQNTVSQEEGTITYFENSKRCLFLEMSLNRVTVEIKALYTTSFEV